MFQLQWIWHNLKGYRKFYVTALVLSIVCNALYLTTPYFSKELVDKFLSSKDKTARCASSCGVSSFPYRQA